MLPLKTEGKIIPISIYLVTLMQTILSHLGLLLLHRASTSFLAVALVFDVWASMLTAEINWKKFWPGTEIWIPQLSLMYIGWWFQISGCFMLFLLPKPTSQQDPNWLMGTKAGPRPVQDDICRRSRDWELNKHWMRSRTRTFSQHSCFSWGL